MPLDRILEEPKYATGDYMRAEEGFYKEYFGSRIGVSGDDNPKGVKEIHIKAHSIYMFNLTKTKPFHSSQKVVKEFGKYEDGEYGEFVLRLETNKEFFGAILQMGAELEITSPEEVRNEMKIRVEGIINRYK